FQIIEGFAVDLLAERHHFFNALAEALARARDRLFHALEETGLFFGAAEQGLDHGLFRTDQDTMKTLNGLNEAHCPESLIIDREGPGNSRLRQSRFLCPRLFARLLPDG